MNENYIKVRSEDKSDASNVKSTTLVADETGVRFYHADSGSGDSSKDRIWTLVLPNGNARTKVTSNSIGVYTLNSSGAEQVKWKLNIPNGETQIIPTSSIIGIDPITTESTSSDVAIRHNRIGESGTYGDSSKDISNGETFNVLKVVTDGFGHASHIENSRIRLLITEASASTDGLMTSAQVKTLNNIPAPVWKQYELLQNQVDISPGTTYIAQTYGVLIPLINETIANYGGYTENSFIVHDSSSGKLRITHGGKYKISASLYFQHYASGEMSTSIHILYGQNANFNPPTPGADPRCTELCSTKVCMGVGTGAINLGPKYVDLPTGTYVGVYANVQTSSSDSSIVLKNNSTYVNIEFVGERE